MYTDSKLVVEKKENRKKERRNRGKMKQITMKMKNSVATKGEKKERRTAGNIRCNFFIVTHCIIDYNFI